MLRPVDYRSVVFTFTDGCRYSMSPWGKDFVEVGTWRVELPGGIKMTCPHGEVQDVTPDGRLVHRVNGETVYGERVTPYD